MFDLWSKREIQLLIMLIGCVVLLISTLLYVVMTHNPDQAGTGGEVPLPDIAQEEADGLLQKQDDTVNEPGEIVIDVKGAVHAPGIYHLPADARVYEAIEAAGGATDEADIARLNMADFLTDGMAVIVPKEGEEADGLLPASGSANGGDTAAGKVNVNRATEAELQTLSGIGPAKAAAIIKEREENGPFQTVDDLTRVTGIGEKTLENLRDDITVK